MLHIYCFQAHLHIYSPVQLLTVRRQVLKLYAILLEHTMAFDDKGYQEIALASRYVTRSGTPIYSPCCASCLIFTVYPSLASYLGVGCAHHGGGLSIDLRCVAFLSMPSQSSAFDSSRTCSGAHPTGAAGVRSDTDVVCTRTIAGGKTAVSWGAVEALGLLYRRCR